MSAVLLAVGGLVASGKSTLARELASELDAAHLEADAVRSGLLAAEPGSGLSPYLDDQVYFALLKQAADLLEEGRSVVIDACFPRRAERREARALARIHRARFLFIECRAKEETLHQRLAQREPQRGWAAISADLAARYERPTGLRTEDALEVWSEQPMATLVASVQKQLAHPGVRPEAQLAAAPRAARVLAQPAAVTFDCWNTLLFEEDWQAAHALRVDAVAQAAAEAGKEVSVIDAGIAFDAAWERHMRIWRGGASTGAREVAVWALAELGLRTPEPALGHLVTRFQEASHSSGVRALEGARETLASLHGRNIPCALVCDTGLTPGRVVRRHLERLGLLEYLQSFAFSDEVGVPKPHPRAFRVALEPLGVPWEQAWHVGDLRHTDVAGARALGMTSVRLRARHDDTGEEEEADLVVASHEELLRELLSPRNAA
jgi:putative hydrolase of the HAD superfamily